MVNLLGNGKSLGRITLQASQSEAFSMAAEICRDLKLRIQDVNPEKFMIRGKTRLSWIKNKFAQKFWVLVRDAGESSVIDVYYGAPGIAGADAGPLIRPFYKKLCERTGLQPSLETGVLSVRDGDVEDSVGEAVPKAEDAAPPSGSPRGGPGSGSPADRYSFYR